MNTKTQPIPLQETFIRFSDIAKSMDFTGKVALITGASRGIGAATAIALGSRGAEVIVNYNKNEQAAKDVLAKAGGKGMILQCDVRSEEQVKSMFSSIKEKYGTIDILVNNAGIVIVTPFSELTLEQWNNMFATNLTSMFLCSQQAAKIMKEGSIVNISSIRGLLDQGRAPIIDYSATKAASISFTKTLAKELAPNIRVNSVGPGMTNTDNVQNIPAESIAKFKEDIYLKRLIEPDEVANAIVFLCSELASGITGALLMVDGGQSLS